jgi:Na+-driven multidrug efflux pump
MPYAAALRRPGRITVIGWVLLILVVLLLIHGVAMGAHHVDGSGCATCVVALLAIMVALAIVDTSAAIHPVPPLAFPTMHQLRHPDALRSRHPPNDGTVLRL